MEVRPGYKLTELGAIPEEWAVDSLTSVTPRNVRNGIVDGPFGSNLKTIHYRTAGIPIVTSGYVTGGEFRADNYLYVEKQKFDEEKRSAVHPGDIVMAKIGARCGASAILPSDHPIGILSGNALKITVDETRHSTVYIWQVLWSLYSEGNVEALRTVGAQPAISMAILKKHKIALPPRPEQRAIAEVLSDVDALLGGLGRLIVKKRDLKQASMQQLLTGKTRLPGFDGKWKIKRLGDVLAICHGKNQRDVATPDGLYPILASGGQIGAASRPLYDKPSVLIGRKGTINKPQFMDTPFWTVDTLFYSEMKNSNSARFFFYMFCMIDWMKFNEASGVPSLNARTIERIEIDCPEPREQIAIAQALTDMDAELAALEARRDKTRALKQAMMQELLTGNTRLV